jgi:hypothetical protein
MDTLPIRMFGSYNETLSDKVSIKKNGGVEVISCSNKKCLSVQVNIGQKVFGKTYDLANILNHFNFLGLFYY